MGIESPSKITDKFLRSQNTHNRHQFNQRKHFRKEVKNNFIQFKILDLIKILATRNIQRTRGSLN